MEWHRWEGEVEGTSGNHLVHPPTQHRLSIELRPDFIGLDYSWILKTSKTAQCKYKRI